MPLVAQSIVVLVGAITGLHATDPDPVTEIHRGQSLQFAHQSHLIAGFQGNGAVPGFETWLGDGDLVAARVQLKIQAGRAIFLAVDGDLIADNV